jgi:hypothetical protein
MGAKRKQRGARCAAMEMPDWRALAVSVALMVTLALSQHL